MTYRLVGVAGTAVNSIGLAGNLVSLLLLKFHRPKSPTLSLLFTLTLVDMFILVTNQYFYNIPSLDQLSQETLVNKYYHSFYLWIILHCVAKVLRDRQRQTNRQTHRHIDRQTGIQSSRKKV